MWICGISVILLARLSAQWDSPHLLYEVSEVTLREVITVTQCYLFSPFFNANLLDTMGICADNYLYLCPDNGVTQRPGQCLSLHSSPPRSSSLGIIVGLKETVSPLESNDWCHWVFQSPLFFIHFIYAACLIWFWLDQINTPQLFLDAYVTCTIKRQLKENGKTNC